MFIPGFKYNPDTQTYFYCPDCGNGWMILIAATLICVVLWADERGRNHGDVAGER